MGTGKLIFVLKDRNVLYFVQEWHYSNFYPTTYYYYQFNNNMKCVLIGKGKKFIWYERIK